MKIAIVGTGLTGLTAGYRLSKQGHEVTLFEASPSLGGLAAAFPVGSDRLDRFYHHMFVSDSELLNLFDELSLTQKLHWFEPKNAIFIEDKLYPFTSPLDLLRFKPLRLLTRIRMGLLVLRSKFINDYKPFENITASEWITKRSGKEAFQKVWGPLLNSKFDVDSDKVSGTWIWNKFKLRGSSRGKSIAKEQLGYINGGFEALAYTLSGRIKESNGTIRQNTPVRAISRSEEGFWQIKTDYDSTTFDNVLFTAAPELLSGLCPSLTQDYKNKLESIAFKANLCLTLELTKSLSPYYWITVSQKELPFVLVIEHTNLVGTGSYGSTIVYVSRYLDASDPLFKAEDKDIYNLFVNGLAKIFPDFTPDCIKKYTLSRARFAQPVVTLGYGERIPALKTPENGLYLASMPQIYPEDRGLNYAVRLGNQVADEILNHQPINTSGQVL